MKQIDLTEFPTNLICGNFVKFRTKINVTSVFLVNQDRKQKHRPKQITSKVFIEAATAASFCQRASICLSLLLPALATVTRTIRKSPTVQMAATGSTTVANRPETEAKEIIMVFTSETENGDGQWGMTAFCQGLQRTQDKWSSNNLFIQGQQHSNRRKIAIYTHKHTDYATLL